MLLTELRKKNAAGRCTAEDVREMFAKQNGRCRYCSIQIDEGFQIDHWIPLSKGGSNYPDNLVLACQNCNASKHDKMPHEFLKRL